MGEKLLITYAALLRGSNVGGRTIKMDALKHAFEELGLCEVKTLLASGNVIFATDESDVHQLKQLIENRLLASFGFPISIILREIDYLQQLVDQNPFHDFSALHDLRLYVSFLGESTKKSIIIPYISPNKDFKIISMTAGEIFSVLKAGGKTTDAMELIEKAFGKNVTTRNWNTIKKICAVAK